MKWQTRARVQSILAHLPGGRSLYFQMQKSRGMLGDLTRFTREKIGHTGYMLRALAQAGYRLEGLHTVEIGTGWTPIAPMLFYLLGQQRCDSYDVNPYLKAELALGSARVIAEHPADLADSLPWPVDSSRLAQLRTSTGLPDLLRTIDLTYHSPGDARATGLPDGSVDLVYSISTLEHIPPADLQAILRESYRILKPGGLILHLIDPSDHYASSDRTISSINFLRFSTQKWQRFNNPFVYQNRLRAPEYLQLATDAGFTIVTATPVIDQNALQNLARFPLDAAFSGFTAEEVCTTTLTLLARKLISIQHGRSDL